MSTSAGPGGWQRRNEIAGLSENFGHSKNACCVFDIISIFPSRYGKGSDIPRGVHTTDAVLVERQAAYHHRQVRYHRQAAGEVRSTAEVVDLQQLDLDHRNWHIRS
jgi:hypothetical protein